MIILKFDNQSMVRLENSSGIFPTRPAYPSSGWARSIIQISLANIFLCRDSLPSVVRKNRPADQDCIAVIVIVPSSVSCWPVVIDSRLNLVRPIWSDAIHRGDKNFVIVCRRVIFSKNLLGEILLTLARALLLISPIPKAGTVAQHLFFFILLNINTNRIEEKKPFFPALNSGSNQSNISRKSRDGPRPPNYPSILKDRNF